MPIKSFFETIVKNKSLITKHDVKCFSNDELPFYIANFTLKNGTKLSDVFYQLPHGIIDKKITGIGGTTLELSSKRHSIIVEPLRAIASSKASLDKNFLYVGSPCGKFRTKVSNESIRRYLLNKDIQFKKILVVADSLPSFMDTLVDTIGEKIYNDFFLLIDEIDSFQCDSTFRDSLELCLDIYKKFHLESRAMITATLIKFSDPFLAKESLTTINYTKEERRRIHLIHTNTLDGYLAQRILTLYSINDEWKIVVACNSIDLILDTIRDLESSFEFDSSMFSILCSHTSSQKAGIYFGEIFNGQLPRHINFLTSAYFTGLDILEDYASICVCTTNDPKTLLSEHKMTQIAGRCRPGVLVEEIIYYCGSHHRKRFFGKDDLIEIAKLNLLSMQCFDHQYEKNEYLKSKIESIQDSLISLGTHFGYNLVRKNIHKHRCISYFNIDAFLENQRIENLYRNKYQLKRLFEKDHDILFTESESYRGKKKDSGDKLSKEIKAKLIAEVLDQIEATNGDKDRLIKLRQSIKNSLDKEKVFSIYKDLLTYFTHSTALTKTHEFSVKRDLREFNHYLHSVKFLSESSLYKTMIVSAFPINTIVSNIEIQKILLEIHTQLNYPVNTLDSPLSAFKLLSCYFQTSANRDGTHLIKGLNPKQIELEK